MPGLSPLDPSSHSRPDLAIVTDLKLALTVDFEKKIFHGTIDIHVKKIDPKVKEVILDSKELKIDKIYDYQSNQALDFKIENPVDEFGSKLSIELPPKKGNTYILVVHYQTSPNASGLHWLKPEQTLGKKCPYVFSQFQAVHARSVLPCQDTPYVKTPYRALITTPKELTAVMSSYRHDKIHTPDGISYYFSQKIPIPSYLIAIAIGALECRKIGPRSHVWSEKEIVEQAAYEFAETENQLQAAEDICGPYLWTVYDLLVLPPSFPFGGMENPCLTFVTPTILAGDRSLTNVIAHEIAHSWTGNLVTNRNFEHFWLNEGFTVFIERKILGRLTSVQEHDFASICGTVELSETIERMSYYNRLTCLVVDLANVHPDDSFCVVPYEKGHTFLRYLERVVGGPEDFEPFLRAYLDVYKYKSIDTGEFKSFFEKYFVENPCIRNIDWDRWLYKPGMPPVIPKYDDTLLEKGIIYKKRWIHWEHEDEPLPFTKREIKKLSVNQKIHLLQQIFDEPPQEISKLEKIEKIFGFGRVRNCEIKFRWLRIGIKARWEEKVDCTLEWISEIGRMKFVRVLYRDLYDWEEVRQRAIDNYLEYRHTMMHVGEYTVAKDLHLKI